MSPQLNVTSTESSGGGGLPTGTGTLFLAGIFDQGPPIPALYAKCQSLTDVVTNFGPRSVTSSRAYDALDCFFNEGGGTGKVAYITRVTDTTATTAALTLNDGESAPKPTVLVSALTPGSAGDNTEITVTTGQGQSFTASTSTVTNPTVLTSVSSFASVGVGTPVTGPGIPTGTYVTAINPTAETVTINQAATATASGVTVQPGEITVQVLSFDSSGDELSDETHGPYFTTGQLIADTTSLLVSFTQSPATGNTTNLPAPVTAASLSGGADATDLTDASHVAALANFPATLPKGTVVLPGRVSQTAWQGIRNHCNAYERFGVLDLTDASTGAAVVSQANGLPQGDWSRCLPIQGSATIPGIGAGPSRTVPGSAAVAALCAQVAQGNNQAAAPCGVRWPLTYITGFTEFFGPGGNFAQADVNSMEAVGINCFALFSNVLCLFGFTTFETTDLVFDQATAARERMALTSDFEQVMAPYLFDPIDLASIENMTTGLSGVVQEHYAGGALYDMGTGQIASAGLINTAAPVNSPQTAQAKQLNAVFDGHITRYADTVNVQNVVFPVSVALPGATS